MKKCSKCKIEKPLNEFYNDKNRKTGLTPSCKKCQNQYQEDNKEKRAEQKKQYYQINKEKKLEYNKQYYNKNKEKFAINGKKWAKINREKINESARKNYKLNNEKILERRRKIIQNRKKIEPIYKFKCNVRALILNSFKRGKNQFQKNAKTENILGCTIDEFRLYIQSQFKKGMTFENHGYWHLDHIIPLANATTEEEIIKLNHYTNFQPLWAKENISKGDKIIEKQLKLL